MYAYITDAMMEVVHDLWVPVYNFVHSKDHQLCKQYFIVRPKQSLNFQTQTQSKECGSDLRGTCIAVDDLVCKLYYSTYILFHFCYWFHMSKNLKKPLVFSKQSSIENIACIYSINIVHEINDSSISTVLCEEI